MGRKRWGENEQELIGAPHETPRLQSVFLGANATSFTTLLADESTSDKKISAPMGSPSVTMTRRENPHHNT